MKLNLGARKGRLSITLLVAGEVARERYHAAMIRHNEACTCSRGHDVMRDEGPFCVERTRIAEVDMPNVTKAEARLHHYGRSLAGLAGEFAGYTQRYA